MKKLVAFALVLSLGLFCAVGCGKAPAPAKKAETKPGAAAPAAGAKKDEAKAPAADVKKEEPKKEEGKK